MTDQLVETGLNAEALAALEETVRGSVLTPGDARLRRGALDLERADRSAPGADRAVQRRGRRRRCGQLRARAGARLSIKAGGHNVAGNAVNDGGLVIDLSQMRGVHVDPDAQDGARAGRRDLGRFDRETQLFGLAVPGGVVSTTGVAGLTLHGGIGHLRRKHGLLDRQPPLGRHRHRRRAVPAGQRDRERGSVLGGPRRRQQLRRRHVVRVPGAPGRADGVRRRDLLPVRGGVDGAVRLARLHGHGPGGAQLAGGLLEHPAGPAVPARAPRHPDRRRRRGLLRLGRGGRAGRAAAARARGAARRRRAVPGPGSASRAGSTRSSRRASCATGSRGPSPSSPTR